jgi:hypothetical protein
MTESLRLARRIGGRTLRRELRVLMHNDNDRAQAWRAMVVLNRLRKPRLTDRDRSVVRCLVMWDLERLHDDDREPWPSSWSLRAGRLVLDDAWATELRRRSGPNGDDAAARSLLETWRGGPDS